MKVTSSIESKSPKFIMLGGFLGAGKTTTLLQLARAFQEDGHRVGIVTNDQAEGLVDTRLVDEANIPVREIGGGCFCCKSDALVEALAALEEAHHPNVFLTEPVGSCTDLVATVVRPLADVYKAGFSIAPYAVIIDPYRAIEVLGLGRKAGFTSEVNYIYRKQLEEADIIVVNKIDVVPDAMLKQLVSALTEEYPGAKILEISSRGNQHVDLLYSILSSENHHSSKSLEVDYEKYGRGEAILGWYNGSFAIGQLNFEDSVTDANKILEELAEEVVTAANEKQIEIAHFKACVSSSSKPHSEEVLSEGKLAAISITRNDEELVLRRKFDGEFKEGTLTINLRAEAMSEVLVEIVNNALKKVELFDRILSRHEQNFQPGQPKPIYRIAS